MILVTCTECKWVSFALDRESIEAEIKVFNDFFDTLPEERQQELYNGKRSTLDNYRCLGCGGLEFRPYVHETDYLPSGTTINSVLYEEKGA